jgi:hypothetical protein
MGKHFTHKAGVHLVVIKKRIHKEQDHKKWKEKGEYMGNSEKKLREDVVTAVL